MPGEGNDMYWYENVDKATYQGIPALHDPRVRPVPCPFDCGYCPKLMPAVIESNFRKHIQEHCPVVKEMREKAASNVLAMEHRGEPTFNFRVEEDACDCVDCKCRSADVRQSAPPPAPDSHEGSGEGHTPIVEYGSGMRRTDQAGKPDYTLVDLAMLKRWAVHMTKGAETHGRENWRQAHTAEDLQRFRTSAFRHFIAWLEEETNEDHASALFFNVAGAEMVKTKMVENDSFR